MADGKIYITISDTRGGSGTGVGGEGSAGNEGTNKENALALYARHRFFNLVENQAKQYVSYTVGNIGNFTGSYQSQRDTEQMLKGMTFAVNLGMSAIAGAKIGGAPGAIIATSITLLSSFQSAYYKGYAEEFQIRKTNRNIDLMRKRLGLEGLTDGSRTGGY